MSTPITIGGPGFGRVPRRQNSTEALNRELEDISINKENSGVESRVSFLVYTILHGRMHCLCSCDYNAWKRLCSRQSRQLFSVYIVVARGKTSTHSLMSIMYDTNDFLKFIIACCVDALPFVIKTWAMMITWSVLWGFYLHTHTHTHKRHTYNIHHNVLWVHVSHLESTLINTMCLHRNRIAKADHTTDYTMRCLREMALYPNLKAVSVLNKRIT